MTTEHVAGCSGLHTAAITCAHAAAARVAVEDPMLAAVFGHEPGCVGFHHELLSCAEATRIRDENRERNADWDCPNSPSRVQAHNFDFDWESDDDDAAECVYGCGMTWGRLRGVEE